MQQVSVVSASGETARCKEEHRAADVETERQVSLASSCPIIPLIIVRLCITRHPTFETVECVSKSVNGVCWQVGEW